MKLTRTRALLVLIALTTFVAATAAIGLASPGTDATTAAIGYRASQATEQHPDQVLDWNQIFIDTLIATNTPNSRVSGSGRSFTPRSSMPTTASSGATRRSSFTMRRPAGASRRAAVIAAAYTALVGLFPAQTGGAERSYAASLAALSDDGEDGGRIPRARHRLGNRGGAGRARLARDRWVQRAAIPPFTGGTAVGQWRPTPPAFGPMSAQGLAFTATFVLDSNTQFRPGPPRALTSADLHGRFQRRQGARPQDRIDAHRRPDGARSVLGGQRQRPLESGGEPDGARQPPVHVREQPAARGPEHRDGRHGVHHLERQAILRRRSDRSDLAAGDRDPAGGHRRQSGHRCPTRTGCRSSPRRRTRNTRPGIPASTARLRPFSSATSTTAQTFTLTTSRTAEPHVHQHRASARGREQRPRLGRHALPEHRRDQRRRGRGDRQLRQ